MSVYGRKSGITAAVCTALLLAVTTLQVAAPEWPSSLTDPVRATFILPDGVPSAPPLRSPREERAWELISRYAVRYGIPEKAHLMFGVVRTESGFDPAAVSPGGAYEGMCQFTPRTFRWAVKMMRREGAIEAGAVLSPMNAEQSVQVMAWMWSQGYQNHWGPARRFLSKVARTNEGARVKTSPS